ncbi:MAG: class I SAM-dependent methyltransferase [Phaeodactylibacter sp.]|nr:class I SAM-dependent methyltransferase [Phaeodactylibacter sp.]MCB9299633.1 class I SAM-dependent methyltransferase [Lewinellaceae bacterium]
MKNKNQSNTASPDTLYSRLFARLYNPVMQGTEANHLLEKRATLLSRTRGKVLEVGIGTGVNFPLYPAEAEVLGIEPSAAMMAYARKRIQEQQGKAKITLMQAGIGDAQVAAAAPATGYDFIVTTLVLCTIPNLEATIRQFKDWLKPGGQLLVLEHIRDERQPHRWLQRSITPVWKHLAEGCHLDRPTDQLLKENGFHAIEEQYFRYWVTFYWAVLSWQ